jgi:hypothetical protein
MKSRSMRWAEHVACMGKMKNECKILVISLKRRDTNKRIILKFILNKWGLTAWTEFMWFKIGTMASSCEPTYTINGRKFL